MIFHDIFLVQSLTFIPFRSIAMYYWPFVISYRDEQNFSVCYHTILPLGNTGKNSAIVKRKVILTVYPSVCLSVCLSIHLSVYLYVCLSICLFIHLSVYPSVCLSICLFIHLSVYPSGCQSIYLFVGLCVHFLFL
jgi:hypothetical protein